MRVSRKRDLDDKGRWIKCQFRKVGMQCIACDKMAAEYAETGELALREPSESDR